MKNLKFLSIVFLLNFFFVSCQKENLDAEIQETANTTANLVSCTISDDIYCGELTGDLNNFFTNNLASCVNITPCPAGSSCVFGGTVYKTYSYNIDSDDDINANTEILTPFLNDANNLIASVGGVCNLTANVHSNTGCNADPGTVTIRIRYYVCENNCSVGNDENCDELFGSILPNFLANDLENCLDTVASCPPGSSCVFGGTILRYYSYYVDSDDDVNADTEIINNIINDGNLIINTYANGSACQMNVSIHSYSGCNESQGDLCIKFDYYVCEPDCIINIGNDENCDELFSSILPNYLNNTIYDCYDVVRECPRGTQCEPVVRIKNLDISYYVDSDDDVNAMDEIISVIQAELDVLSLGGSFCYLDIVYTSRPTCFRGKNKVGLQIRYSRCIRREIIDIEQVEITNKL